MKNVFYLHPDGIILHSSFRQRRHSSFYILLPSPFGEGLGVRLLTWKALLSSCRFQDSRYICFAHFLPCPQ